MECGALIRPLLATALLCGLVAGCRGLDLGDNPTPEVAKQSGPLVVPPALRSGPSK